MNLICFLNCKVAFSRISFKNKKFAVLHAVILIIYTKIILWGDYGAELNVTFEMTLNCQSQPRSLTDTQTNLLFTRDKDQRERKLIIKINLQAKLAVCVQVKSSQVMIIIRNVILTRRHVNLQDLLREKRFARRSGGK